MKFSDYSVSLTSTTIIGGEGAVQSQSSTGTADANMEAPQQQSDTGSALIWFIYIPIMVASMYFFMIRPQKKREKQLRDMQSAIKAGDEIVTSGGFYGKVTEVCENCFIVEFGTNKGIKIPVNKENVLGVKSPVLTTSSTNKEAKE